MILDLSDEQAQALLNLLIDTIEADRYPMSPRIRLLQAILGKCGEVGGLPPELGTRLRRYTTPPPPTMAQKKAVNRALRSIVRRYPRYALMGGKGRKPSYLYEPADPRSVMWAKLTVERREFVSLSDVARELNGLEELKRP